ncbi:MAG: hypothetical protein KH031_08175 [Clostridiales bacterium]|nr:hypothetical protein [Clostridiales bacterium]
MMVYQEGKEKALLFLLYAAIIWAFGGTFLMAHGMGAVMFFVLGYAVWKIKGISSIAVNLILTVFLSGLALAISLEPGFLQSKQVVFLVGFLIVITAARIIISWLYRKKTLKKAIMANSFLVGLMMQKLANQSGFYIHDPQNIQASVMFFLSGVVTAVNLVVFLMLLANCIDFAGMKVNVDKRTVKYFMWSFVPAIAIMLIQGSE